VMRGALYAACDLPNCPPRTTRAGGFYVPRGYRTRVLSEPSRAGSPLGQVPALVLGLMGNPPY